MSGQDLIHMCFFHPMNWHCDSKDRCPNSVSLNTADCSEIQDTCFDQSSMFYASHRLCRPEAFFFPALMPSANFVATVAEAVMSSALITPESLNSLSYIRRSASTEVRACTRSLRSAQTLQPFVLGWSSAFVCCFVILDFSLIYLFLACCTTASKSLLAKSQLLCAFFLLLVIFMFCLYYF